ncbi:hypothetical protein Tsubulata_041258 [Turnera subulata]|uniref:F-box domain-containing protein n=1 Tax=Turnera subulata TaxID=218843 RepID=A0A9Q0EZV7_9ROSI|nr:hypothetical protein Tsubulata_041258 [Turnera subulata]
MELKSAKKKYGDAPTRFRRYDLLPDDALRLIFLKTSLVDHIRLRVVCKSWKNLLDGGDIRSASILPWIMFYRWQPVDGDEGFVEGLCKLYDPSHRKTYTLENGITNRGSKATHKFVGARIQESKYGWVLFQKRTSLFLYCPFTGEVVDLPKLERPAILATFSSNPTSGDCLFFVFSGDRKGGSVTYSISLCRRVGEATQLAGTLNDFSPAMRVAHYSFKTNDYLPLLDAYSKATMSPAEMYDKRVGVLETNLPNLEIRLLMMFSLECL